MKYQFILSYQATDSEDVLTHTCQPLYSDGLGVAIDREEGEWYYKRKLNGKINFVRGDYNWIMSQPFDGSFTLTINESHDGGITWNSYFESNFSRVNLEIDEDNRRATLTGITESGEYKIIDNARREEYDLMKIIPDADAREVQGQVHPALAMVDYRSTEIKNSDMYCHVPILAGGYKESKNDYSKTHDVNTNGSWLLCKVYAEAKVEMLNPLSEMNGIYFGELSTSASIHVSDEPINTLSGTLYHKDNNNCKLVLSGFSTGVTGVFIPTVQLYRSDGTTDNNLMGVNDAVYISEYYYPSAYTFIPVGVYKDFKLISITVHYIRATLLTMNGGNADNVLDTGGYYQRMAAFEGSGLNVVVSSRTVEQPNGHRLIPGTGEQGTIPQYFAPPDDTQDWIPLAENNWNYGSLWYTITPSVQNGLLDPANLGSFRWTRCWELGTCLNHLLQKITNGKVTFSESTAGSEYLYADVNPVTGGEPFRYLFTQKSNVMRPSNSGDSAARCTVTLDWFLELLRNAFNCYWWLEPANGGTYAFRVEHVEYFRRGRSYTGQLTAQLNLAALLPRRNYLVNGHPAKHLDDNLHRYTYDLKNMVEQYTFSWQGDGGSDDFKGNPMFFKAGWIERGSVENRQVDYIFADLPWLMLNAGTDTASSKNFEGLFIFSGYLPFGGIWTENAAPEIQRMFITNGDTAVTMDLFATIPAGQEASLVLVNRQTHIETTIRNILGTGRPQHIKIQFDGLYTSVDALLFDFGTDYADAFIYRAHTNQGFVYYVPNVANLLGDGYLQNGALAWPYLQCEHLHYDIPAQKWSYDSDDLDDINTRNAWQDTGTVKMVKKQETTILPLPLPADEYRLDHGVIGGLRDSLGNLQIGIVENATVNLSSRNCKLKLMYDIIT